MYLVESMKIRKNISKLKSIVFVALLLNTLHFSYSALVAQTLTNSPYSRYGIGKIQSPGFIQNFSMGGIGIALQNDSTAPFYTNVSNPASYTSIRLTTFELGVMSNMEKFETQSSRQSVDNTSLGYLSVAVPVSRWWGSSFGLQPYSYVGYKVSDQSTVDTTGTVNYIYEGSGGVNRFYFGNAIKPFYKYAESFLKSAKYKKLREADDSEKIRKIERRRRNISNFSMGFNMSYLFGNTKNIRKVEYPATAQAYNTLITKETNIRDFVFDYGLQQVFEINAALKQNSLKNDTINKQSSFIRRELQENIKIILGMNFSLANNIDAKSDLLTVNYVKENSPIDTIQYETGTKGKINLPFSIGAGITIKKGERWTIGSEFATQEWSKFNSFGENGNLKNSKRIAFGGQYIPSKGSDVSASYLKRIHYRAGVRYSNTYLELKDTPINEYGVSLGFGFPLGRNKQLQYSMINIAAEVGQLGTTENGLVKEQFVKIVLGFSLNDRWFIKSKFD